MTELTKTATGRLWILHNGNRRDPLYTCRVADFPTATGARVYMERELERIANAPRYSVKWLSDAVAGL